MKHSRTIDEQAADWLVRRDLADTAGAGADALAAWLAADARHREAYLRLELAWRQADRLKTMRPLSGCVDADILKQRRPAFPRLSARVWRERQFRWAAVVASLAVVAAIVWYASSPFSWHTYATQVGGYQRVLLGDGTRVELNTDTKLKVRFSTRREVKLLRGEASFNVARDPQRPFEVDAAGTSIRAVGTAFNVRFYGTEKVEVVVTEGRVAVRRKTSQLDFSPADAPVSTLSSGESATANTGGVAVREMAPEDLRRHVSWQTGELVFRGESLAQAVAEFNRYNLRQLSIADPALASLKVGGNFRANDPQSFVKALQSSFSIDAELDADGGWTLQP